MKFDDRLAFDIIMKYLLMASLFVRGIEGKTQSSSQNRTARQKVNFRTDSKTGPG